MRRSLTERLLDDELAVVRPSLTEVPDVSVWREGTDVFVSFNSGIAPAGGLYRLSCSGFDADPPSVAMLDPESRRELLIQEWPTGVPHSLHPLTNKPFVCSQGIAEYHSHPSHTDDSWDRYRNTYRLPQTIKLLLRKAGVQVP